jgi:hypothetical protein
MQRIVLTDGSARWFDREKAERFEETTHWNGNNHISDATGSQWEHEALYRTAGKKWVLHHWSQWQGSEPTWEEIDAEAAARWLVTNGHEHPDAEQQIAALEIQ